MVKKKKKGEEIPFNQIGFVTVEAKKEVKQDYDLDNVFKEQTKDKGKSTPSKLAPEEEEKKETKLKKVKEFKPSKKTPEENPFKTEVVGSVMTSMSFPGLSSEQNPY